MAKRTVSQALASEFLRRRHFLFTVLRFAAPLGILISLIFLKIAKHPILDQMTFMTFDQFERNRPRPYEDAGIRVLDLDDESLKRLGQWPWPRTQLADLVARLKKFGAAAVAFDAVFPEPDRTSPANILPLWPKTAETQALLVRAKSLPDHDRIFADAVKQAGNVVGGFVLIPEDNGEIPTQKAQYGISGDPADLLRWLHSWKGAVLNRPEFEKAAAGLGTVSFVPELDSIIRRVPLFYTIKGRTVPSLAAEAIRVGTGTTAFKIKTSTGSGVKTFGQNTGIEKVGIGNFMIPTDQRGKIWIYYTRPEDDYKRVIPVWKIYEKNFDRKLLDGTIVFFGTSAAGLKDLRSTPLNAAAAGVSVHAQVAEQIVLQNFLRREDWTHGAELLYMVGGGLALLILLPWMGAFWSAAFGVGAIGGAWWYSWHQFTNTHILFDPFFPSIGLLGVYLSSTLIGYLSTEAEKKQIRGAFSVYLNPSMVEELAKDPEKLQLGGVTRTMTILFSDIRGFTTMSEQFDSQGLTTRINGILTPLTQVIMERRGTIDKYIGDCIMAFWNAPLDDQQHAQNACRSALAMSKRLEEIRPSFEKEDVKAGRKVAPLDIGIGLNSGPCCVGNLGSDMRFNYSVLGDDVNLASRLEGQSKAYGVRIVIGEHTRDLAPEFAALELDLLQVKGKTKPVQIFTLVGEPDLAAKPAFKELAAAHADALKDYRSQKWNDARAWIATCREILERPGPEHDQFAAIKKYYKILEERIEYFEAHPPPKDWDGVYIATSK
ncbi:MAG: adenylate/guanylate cyclase domain-containing protein [Elusimicrobia bacterium]|nr:adenylate/guanylate cyclase domain-containing protein [Elusimicrobiota bacterium]